MNTKCCSILLKKKSGQSPFKTIYSLDYYDGEIAGFAQCTICNKIYFFWMIAWDKWQDYRLYSIKEFTVDISKILDKKFNEKGIFVPEELPSAIEKEIENCQKSKNPTYLYTKNIEKKIDKILLSFSR